MAQIVNEKLQLTDNQLGLFVPVPVRGQFSGIFIRDIELILELLI